MVKKIKVVDVVEDEEAKQVAEPVQDIVEIEQPPEDAKPVEEEVVEAEKPIDKPPVLEEEAKPTKQSKQLEYITCDTCNKQMLMKTFKYSHKKMCDAKNKPPPPPPPSLEPKAKPKRVAKPKEAKPKEEVIQQEIPKPQFNGVVSFNEFQPDPFIALREQRQMVRTQRVKTLISQAI